MDSWNSWYGLHIRSRFESLARIALEEKGYEVLLPMARVTNKRNPEKAVSLPLFPKYLFCRLDVRFTSAVLLTPGVISIVGNTTGPEPVNARELEAIRLLLASGLPVTPFHYSDAGEPVHIRRGALEGFSGLLVQINDSYRLVASVSLFRRSISVELDRNWASAAKLTASLS